MTLIPLTFDPFYTQKEYTPWRRLKTVTILNTLGEHAEFISVPYNVQIEIARLIELGCYNETVRQSTNMCIKCIWEDDIFEHIYHVQNYRIIALIDTYYNTNAATLVHAIITRSIQLFLIGSMPTKDLVPDGYTQIMERHLNRLEVQVTVKYTEIYVCRRCGGNKTTSMRVQNRRNDEASSFFITCVFCLNKWFA